MTPKNTQNGWFDRAMRRLFNALDINPHVEGDGRLNVTSVLRIYWESLQKLSSVVVMIITLVAIASVIGIIVPLYYKDFFNVFAKGLTAEEAGRLLFGAISTVFALDLFSLVSRRTAMFKLIRLTQAVMTDLRARAFDHVIRHSHAYYTSVFVGALVQKLSRFQRSYDRLADSVVFHIVPTIVTLIGVVIVLLRESPLLALAMILWVVLLITINYYFARWMLKYNVYRAALDSVVTGKTADMFTNQAAIEAHGAYDIERARHLEFTKKQMHVAAFTWNSGHLYHGFQEGSIVLLRYVVFCVGIVLWMRGGFSLGMFMLLHAYVFAVTEKIWPIGQVIRDIYESFADAKEMTEATLRPHDILEIPNAHVFANVEGAIEFANVTFEYGGKRVIDNLSVSIAPGERVALIGPSGAGKSTFVKLVSRIFDPNEGTITLDGIDIREATIKSLKQAISTVPQEPTLFHRPIAANIKYGKQDATDEEMERAARLANCHAFISAHPLGYHALVGERGVKLSGGERQRVVLARAFLKNAPVLVLDEATSSLDSESERQVQEALMRLMKGRTTLIIAHRLSTIRQMDRILVLDQGKLVEDGTHDELLAKEGMYWKLWTVQQNGFIPDLEAANEEGVQDESDLFLA